MHAHLHQTQLRLHTCYLCLTRSSQLLCHICLYIDVLCSSIHLSSCPHPLQVVALGSPSSALALAWLASINRSLFAAQCCVETCVQMYREGRSFNELQVCGWVCMVVFGTDVQAGLGLHTRASGSCSHVAGMAPELHCAGRSVTMC